MPRRKTHRKKSSRHVKASSRFSHAVQRLKKLSAKEQHEAIGMANNTFIRQLCKQVKKLKRAKLQPKAKKGLQKYKKQLRLLLHHRTNMSKRRRMLSQGGGGLLKTILRYVPFVGPIVDLIDRS